jgi:hypothetical protein
MLQSGPTSVFSGAMASPITRFARDIEILSDAVFTVLDFQFDGGESQQVAPNTVTYPANRYKLYEVKRLQLASGIILVHWAAPKSS